MTFDYFVFLVCVCGKYLIQTSLSILLPPSVWSVGRSVHLDVDCWEMTLAVSFFFYHFSSQSFL